MQISDTPIEGCPFRVGDRVVHVLFGAGCVRGFERWGGDMRAIVIAFDHQGEKALMWSFAGGKLSAE